MVVGGTLGHMTWYVYIHTLTLERKVNGNFLWVVGSQVICVLFIIFHLSPYFLESENEHLLCATEHMST